MIPMRQFRWTRLLAAFGSTLFSAILCGVEGETAERVPIRPQTPEAIFAYLDEALRPNLVDPLTVAKNPPFVAGERLQFRVGWSMFTVAQAEMRVRPSAFPGSAEPAYQVVLETRTNAFADAFYRVRNQSWSWLTVDISASLQYGSIQREGDRDRDVVIDFDPVALSALRHDRLKQETDEPIVIVPGTFDPLGIVFFIRSLDFKVGDELVVPTSNGKEVFFTIVRVVDKVERRFRTGRQSAYVLEPDIKDLGGVFRRSKDSSIRFYFSADGRKLPLRMESEVAVGRFWVELTDILPPRDP